MRRKKLAKSEPLLGDKKVKPTVNYTEGVSTVHFGSDHSSDVMATAQQTAKEMQIYSSICLSNHGQNSPKDCGQINKAFVTNDEKSLHEIYELQTIYLSQQKITSQPAIKLESTHNLRHDMNTTNRKLTLSEWDDFLAHISPIDPDNWRRAGILGKIMNIIRAPLLFIGIITIPVVDREKRLSNWCRLLNTLHCITVPLFMVIAIKIDENWTVFGVTLRVMLLIPGAIVAIFVFRTTSAHEQPKYHAAFAYFGFMMSILWIYLLASEIISLLKTVGIIFGMTDTAIGLGVLAWGNSLGDIVANISLADAGYPRMALGASIGAPLLNLLLGFGLSFTLSLEPGQVSPVVYSPTITLLCSTLTIILISLMLSTLVPAEKSRRPFGYMLIASYGIYFALAVCLETGLIKF